MADYVFVNERREQVYDQLFRISELKAKLSSNSGYMKMLQLQESSLNNILEALNHIEKTLDSVISDVDLNTRHSENIISVLSRDVSYFDARLDNYDSLNVPITENPEKREDGDS